MDKKLTDSEIVKALECCIIQCSVCQQCPLLPIKDNRGKCYTNLKKQSLDLINRLQADVMFLSTHCDELQAENKRLKNALTDHEYGNCVAVKNGLIYTHTLEDYDELIGDISAEAYKECIEKVKEKATKYNWVSSGVLLKTEYTIGENSLDNLLKEMIGE